MVTVVAAVELKLRAVPEILLKRVGVLLYLIAKLCCNNLTAAND